MSRPSSAEHRATRAAAVIAATALVVAQVLAIWHQATVRHRWCAEHHDVCEDRGGPPTASAGASGAQDVAFDAGASPRGADEHAACSLQGIRLTSTWPPPERDLVARALPGRTPAVVAPVAPAPARPLLRFAPKTSPPVV